MGVGPERWKPTQRSKREKEQQHEWFTLKGTQIPRRAASHIIKRNTGVFAWAPVLSANLGTGATLAPTAGRDVGARLVFSDGKKVKTTRTAKQVACPPPGKVELRRITLIFWRKGFPV